MQKAWKLTRVGSKRCLYGITGACLVAGCIAAFSWIAPRLISLLATEPVQLRDPASSAILVCKVMIICLAGLAGLGTPD